MLTQDPNDIVITPLSEPGQEQSVDSVTFDSKSVSRHAKLNESCCISDSHEIKENTIKVTKDTVEDLTAQLESSLRQERSVEEIVGPSESMPIGGSCKQRRDYKFDFKRATYATSNNFSLKQKQSQTRDVSYEYKMSSPRSSSASAEKTMIPHPSKCMVAKSFSWATPEPKDRLQRTHSSFSQIGTEDGVPMRSISRFSTLWMTGKSR